MIDGLQRFLAVEGASLLALKQGMDVECAISVAAATHRVAASTFAELVRAKLAACREARAQREVSQPAGTGTMVRTQLEAHVARWRSERNATS